MRYSWIFMQSWQMSREMTMLQEASSGAWEGAIVVDAEERAREVIAAIQAEVNYLFRYLDVSYDDVSTFQRTRREWQTLNILPVRELTRPYWLRSPVPPRRCYSQRR